MKGSKKSGKKALLILSKPRPEHNLWSNFGGSFRVSVASFLSFSELFCALGGEMKIVICAAILLFCIDNAVSSLSGKDVDNEFGSATPESFNEDLLLRPLPDGNVLAHFSMSLTWPVSRRREDGGGHYNIFP
jgi:hypothetical protein